MRSQDDERNGSPEVVLDFTAAGRLPGNLLCRLDEIAVERRAEFNAMIARLSRGQERDIDWWVTWPATRNTHVGKLFTRCLQLTLVAELEKIGARPVIVTDDAAFAKLLRAAGRFQIKFSSRGRWKIPLHNIASSIFNSACAWWAARLMPAEKPLPAAIFAVEEGINESVFANGTKTSHYYPGLTSLISDTDARALHVVPMFYRVRSYRDLFRLMRRSSIPFLVREDYLSLRDYIFAFGHWWRARRFLGKTEEFAGFAIGSLIDADIRTGRLTNSVVQALLSYRFWRKIAGNGDTQIAKLLDWYEGHDRDHTTAAAINWHNLPIRHVAYRHLTSRQYLSAVPVQHEIDAGVVPHHFAVVGAHAAQELRSEVQGLDIYTVPSLRFAQIGPIVRRPDSAKPEILVLLGLEDLFLRTAHAMLTLAFAAPELTAVSWVLRPHPLTPKKAIENIFGGLPSHARISVRSFREDLYSAAIAMGAGTNAMLEALIAGIPVITLAAGNEPTENPIPSSVPPEMSTTCYEASDLPSLILRQLSAPPVSNADRLREELAGTAAAIPGLRQALG